MSLRPYLNEIKVRRIQVDGNIIPREVLQRKRQESEIRKQLLARIAHNANLVEVDNLTAAGENARAAARLREMADALDKLAVA